MIYQSAGSRIYRDTSTAIRVRVGILLTNPLTRQISRRLTRNSLRVVAFHGIADPHHFQMVVGSIVRRYNVVSGEQVADSIQNGTALPPLATWLTFDDGLKSTFEAGGMLADHGVSATIFINPAAMGKPHLLWFQTLDLARRLNLVGTRETHRFSSARLKTIADHERRAEILELQDRIAREGLVPSSMCGTSDDVLAWLNHGHEIGNHTWDHPCLDTCSATEQARQVQLAHRWLEGFGVPLRFFAFPNGNYTAESAASAAQLGYVASLLFDHRLSRVLVSGQPLSRLRLDSEASLSRTESVLSGAHSALYATLRRGDR